MALSLLFTEGFDITDFGSCTLKFYSGGVSQPFLQGRVISGIGSAGAMSIDNTSGTTFTMAAAFGNQNLLFWNGNIQINYTSFSAQVFLILGTAAGPLLQVQVNSDGTISLLDHTGGTIATSVAAMVLNTWYWLEVNAVYGIAGSYEVWLCAAGGTPVKILSGTANLTSTLPDQFTIKWDSPGSYELQLDNITVWTGSALTDRNGPSSVTGLIASAVTSAGGWAFAGAHGTSVLQAIADDFGSYTHTPDGDQSYDVSGGNNLMLMVAKSPCFGLVLGLSLNVCCAPSGGSTGMDVVANERTGAYLIGSFTVVSYNLNQFTADLNGFATYQAIAQFNEEATNWNDLQISTTQWGIEPSAVNVTQVYVEKVTDLTGRKFGCGESSYSF